MSICTSRMVEPDARIEVADIPSRHAFPDGRVEADAHAEVDEVVQHFRCSSDDSDGLLVL